MTVHAAIEMSLADAQALAETIAYDPNWSTAELLAACDHMSPAQKSRMGLALRTIATAQRQEAAELEAEGRCQ